uniref:Uncharacterized protein n=1 Tax=Arundo donax TaxID=35708 RepID=A0A0A9BLU9_ARUDO
MRSGWATWEGLRTPCR